MKWFVAFVVLCCAARAFAAAPTFSSAPLSIPTENSSSASSLATPPTPTDLGAGGVLVGRGLWTAMGKGYGARWTSNGSGFDLYARAFNGGDSFSSADNNAAIGINATGDIAMQVGRSIYIAYRPSPVLQPNVWANRLVYTDGLDVNAIITDRVGFNDVGQIVATSATGIAYYFSSTGQRVSLSSFVGTSARGINNSGTIIGDNLYGSVQGSVFSFTTIPAPGGFTAITLNDINDSGLMVGTARNGSLNMPFTFTADQGLGFLTLPDGYTGGGANGVNGDGDIVGFLRDSAGSFHAAYWREGVAYLLPDATNAAGTSVRLVTATLISDDGYVYADGTSGAFILTPIPEPSICSLAFLLLLGRRPHRRTA